MAISVEATPVEPHVLYTLADFQKITGLGKAAMRSCREKGLTVRYVSNRGFVKGADFLDFINDHAKKEKYISSRQPTRRVSGAD